MDLQNFVTVNVIFYWKRQKLTDTWECFRGIYLPSLCVSNPIARYQMEPVPGTTTRTSKPETKYGKSSSNFSCSQVLHWIFFVKTD